MLRAQRKSALWHGFKKKRRPTEEALQEIAEDIVTLIGRFDKNEKISERSSYKALVRLFTEHCEFRGPEADVVVTPKATDSEGRSANVMQNTSDAEAGYDGHKGPGYQAQIVQVYDTGEDAPGLITGCLAQSAAESDSASLEEVLEQQARMETTPEILLAATGYGSQENVEKKPRKWGEIGGPGTGPGRQNHHRGSVEKSRTKGRARGRGKVHGPLKTQECGRAKERSPGSSASGRANRGLEKDLRQAQWGGGGASCVGPKNRDKEVEGSGEEGGGDVDLFESGEVEYPDGVQNSEEAPQREPKWHNYGSKKRFIGQNESNWSRKSGSSSAHAVGEKNFMPPP